jgi:hypothetical protein
MGGCTNCKGKSGCDDHKGTMMASVEAALERLYPTRTWGEVEDGGADAFEDLEALADEFAQELRAATFVQRGDENEPCDYIWILCMGRTPCVVQVRDHGVAMPEEWGSVDAIEEMYLRVVISQRARFAAVQQVAVEYVNGVVRQKPRAGVYDPPLLHRMQKLVALLPAYELEHVDFGEIAHAPREFSAGVWAELYGGQPSIANYFFYPQPTTMVSTQVIQ